MATILIIEDEAFLRNNIKKMLELKGYLCYTAENGQEGVDSLQQLTPDLIVCDVMMPYMDGFEVLENVRAHPLTAATPFIFLTARADAIDKIKGTELGANKYLTKPFSMIDLIAAVQDLLNNSAC
ncbi:MAG: response regulator [Sphingobacteriia bacterium]|nr:response regulator [Sphingobacteriia bacterium]